MSDGEHHHSVTQCMSFEVVVPERDALRDLCRREPSVARSDEPRRIVGSSTAQLARLWDDLATGNTVVRGIAHSSARCSLTLERREGVRRGPRLSAKRLGILKRVLLGETPKEIAYSLDLAVSTIALACGDCLEAMGAKACSLRSPIALVMAAHASAGFECASARVALEPQGGEGVLLSVERPDLALSRQLSSAEYEVIRLLVEGHSYAQMAALRSGSVRTIANQVASAFRKLRVSGRSSLMAALVRRHGAAGSLAQTFAIARRPSPGAALQ